MTVLHGTMQDGSVIPVQVDAQGRLVAEGLPGPTGPQGIQGPPGPAGPAGADGADGLGGDGAERYVVTVPPSTNTLTIPIDKDYRRIVLEFASLCVQAAGPVYFRLIGSTTRVVRTEFLGHSARLVESASGPGDTFEINQQTDLLAGEMVITRGGYPGSYVFLSRLFLGPYAFFANSAGTMTCTGASRISAIHFALGGGDLETYGKVYVAGHL